jgi:hypothetical protein
MDIDLFNLTIEQKFALAGIVVVVVGYFFLKQRFTRAATVTGILTMTDDPAWLSMDFIGFIGFSGSLESAALASSHERERRTRLWMW